MDSLNYMHMNEWYVSERLMAINESRSPSLETKKMSHL